VLRCDFGRELHPALVEVVAFDASGRELGRDVQRVNLPESRAQAVIVPVLDDTGRTVAARLAWTSAEFGRPRSITAALDGRTSRWTALTGLSCPQSPTASSMCSPLTISRPS
jgi:hypothetical protein